MDRTLLSASRPETPSLGALTKAALGASFFSRDTVRVARELIGTILCVKDEAGLVAGRIVETEAYLGEGQDPASHAHRGPTKRTAVMFGPSGFAYVYFSYGFHHCMNVVAHPATSGAAGAVLIRALEPMGEIDRMRERRGRTKITDLCSGPGKLCQALGIDLGDDARALKPRRSSRAIWIAAPRPDVAAGSRTVAATPRIGIRLNADAPWRFTEPGSAFLSRRG